MQAANDLVAAGSISYNYVRRDGTTAFDAVQTGIHPNANSNDNTLVTSAWTRSRMNEYLMGSMSSAGAVMTGPLYLAGAPTQPLMASTKAYVDNTVVAMGATKLSTAGGQTISGGFNFNVFVMPAGHVVINALNGNYQSVGNAGAFTINAPTADCAVDLMVVNAPNAGAITFSGFMVGPTRAIC